MDRRSLVMASLLPLALAGPASAQSWPDLSEPAPAVGGGEKDAALVVAVEDYSHVSDVAGAKANALAWVSWLTETRGVPRLRIRTLYDGQANEKSIPSKAREVAKLAQPGGTVWFVFIGHGAPSRDGKDGVLVTVDARQSPELLYGRSVSQGQILDLLDEGAQERTVAVVDACFSGRASDGSMLAEGLQPLVTTRPSPGRATLLTAGRSDEFAGRLPGARRPAFSYLALGALRGWGDRDGDGQVTAAEAATWARDVLAASVHGRKQTPQATGANLDLALASVAEAEPDLSAILDGSASSRSTPAPRASRTGPTIDSGRVTDATGELIVSTKPRGGVRLELVSPSGEAISSGSPYRNAEAEPGSWKVKTTAGGYAPLEATISVSVDEVTAKNLELEPLGGLSVVGRPKGALVSVTGPQGFAHEGGLPWKARGLVSGTYRVEVSRTGYASARYEATVSPGEMTTKRVELGRNAGGGTSEGKAGITWVRLPGGTFSMGSTEREQRETYALCERIRGESKCDWAWFAREGPVHRVRVDAFAVAKTEVTVAQYRRCVEAGECRAPSTTSRTCGDDYAEQHNWRGSGREDHPVNCVDWNHARVFCAWAGGRLPTEAEWEYAARSGGRDRSYPWGDELATCDGAVMGEAGSGCGEERTQAVCSKPRGHTTQGLCDMAGNVWEWVADGYESDYYANAPFGNPRGPRGGSNRIHRGGGFYDGAARLRSTGRDYAPLGYTNAALGFRCARSVP